MLDPAFSRLAGGYCVKKATDEVDAGLLALEIGSKLAPHWARRPKVTTKARGCLNILFSAVLGRTDGRNCFWKLVKYFPGKGEESWKAQTSTSW
jgi:hypothetical protein